MPIRCAWCGRQIGEDQRISQESHGICADCARAVDATPPTENGGASRQPEQIRAETGRGQYGA